ncbi:MAG: hypothetical protein ABIN10_06495 [Specibacter sp.]
MADFAVVVGVARYPELSAEGIAPDLDGPNNDATAVLEWLVAADGGGLDRANVKLIRSADFIPPDPGNPQPAEAEVERALKWIELQTRDIRGGRLYLYFSGHGFAPQLEEGALFTAEATQVSPSYIYAHDWLRWFRRAQRFQEFVLWMDCCMNYQQSIPVRPLNMRAETGTGTMGPAFVAVAAQTRSALEGEMADGLVHGVFTWTLLQGLRGGAADERGRITGESLKNFLHTVMPEHLPDRVKSANSVDLQPFVRDDGGIVFRRLSAQPMYRVRLAFPPSAAGRQLQVWTGRPHRLVVAEPLAGTEWTGELVRGLYLAEVPAAGLRQGFQVTGTGDVSCELPGEGPAAAAPAGAGQFQLDIVAQNAAATVTVLDYTFQKIFTATGELHERDLPGVYKIRMEIGRDMGTVKELIVLLDRDTAWDSVAARPLPSPAPIPGSAFTHESHVWPFAEAAAGKGIFAERGPGDAALSVLSRFWGGEPPSTVRTGPPHPMQGMELFRSDGGRLAHMTDECRFDDHSRVDRVAVWERNLEPGVYFLRLMPETGRSIEASVVACAGWLTQLAIQRPNIAAGQQGIGGVVPNGDAAVFMRDLQQFSGHSGQEAVTESFALDSAGGIDLPPASQDAVIEAARIALAQKRNLLAGTRGTNLQKLLLEDFDDPVAGIIGGHLLLMAIDAAAEPEQARARLFDTAMARLQGMVGSWHPDVAALSLRCTDPALRPDTPFTAPPMFSRSWQLIIEASYANADLVPASLWSRVHANGSIGPYFIWATDEASRAAHAKQLEEWIAVHGSRSAERAAATRPAATRSAATRAARLAGLPVAASGIIAARNVPAAVRSILAVQDVPAAVSDDGRRLQIPAAAAETLWREAVTGQPMP